MQKTTIYLPDDLKRRVEQTARLRGCSEADVIREAVDRHTERPRPRLPLFHGAGETDVAEHVDEILAEGFGTD
jgi:hypothetical protein